MIKKEIAKEVDKDTAKEFINDFGKQMGIDNKCGSIKVGKNADFVTMDTNFLNYTKQEELRTIHNAKINQVYFEGNKVFSTNN